ncbi:MAG TPA: right-handed parallel beta-helix repeat-containing protein [bacterium]|nr:right-handed parallel beta-helix repeat-containing protein [bacterium]
MCLQTRHYTELALSISMVVLLLCGVAIAGPSITISTDSDIYGDDDTIEVILTATNRDIECNVDVYVGLLTPDGGVFSLQVEGWTSGVGPWMQEIHLPVGFVLNSWPLGLFDIPCSMPPISDQGQYCFASVLTHAGILEWVCNPSFAPFTFEPVPRSHCYVSAQAGDDGNDGSEASPWKTITHALASVDGSEANRVSIHVAAGTYAASTNGETFPLNMKSWVSLVGASALETIVNAEDAAYHVILCDRVIDATIQGLTITGGNACAQDGDDARGGGILCIRSFLTIADNIIIGNYANWKQAGGVLGGSAICLIDSSPLITGNIIERNQAESGGAVAYFDNSGGRLEGNIIMFNTGSGIYCERSSPVINDNTITSNSQNGIYNRYSSPTITNCVIQENGTEYYGDGIRCSSFCAVEIEGNTIRRNGCGEYSYGVSIGEDSTAEISDNIISENRGGGVCGYGPCTIMAWANTIEDNDGPGVICGYDGCVLEASGNVIRNNTAGIECWDSRVVLWNNEIEGNVRSGEYDYVGAGVFLSDSTADISENRLSGNMARGWGGAFYFYRSSVTCSGNLISDCAAYWGGGVSITDSVVTLDDTLIVGCTAVESGGAMRLSRSIVDIQNCTIADNSAPEYGGILGRDSCRLLDCIVWGNGDDIDGCEARYCCIGEQIEGEGNINADPLFFDGPLGSYYLDPNSPCIDAGSRYLEYGSHHTTQADGAPDTGTVDMGFHYPLP